MNIPELSAIELFQLGARSITVGGLAAALFVALGFFAVSWIVGLALSRVRARAPTHGRAALYLVEKLVTYGLVVFGAVAGLSALGLDLTSIAVFAGALGVGIGLGLQGVVKEFVSGLVLIFDGKVNIGDYIELDTGERGVVHEIGPRAARVRNNDNVDLLVPNSRLIESSLTNWTLHDETRRIHVPFGVAYGTDKDKVRTAVLEAARKVPFSMPEDDRHKHQVWLIGFGDSALNFELLVWPTLEAVKRPRAIQAAYTWAIDDALRAAGIEIPFPQRDIRVRALFGHEEDEALRALKLEAPAKARPAPKPRASPAMTPPRICCAPRMKRPAKNPDYSAATFAWCSCSERKRSASSAAMQPSPAAVTAWRNVSSATSPAA